MSEVLIQQGLQTAIRALSAFASADVTINDHTILDGSSQNAPFVIIENSDDFNGSQNTAAEQTRWNIPVWIWERFTDWETTLNSFRSDRQAILDAFNDASQNLRTAGGLNGVDVQRIRSGAPAGGLYDPDLDPNLRPDAMPLFWGQMLIFETVEF